MIRLFLEALITSREDAVFFGVLFLIIVIGSIYAGYCFIRLFREE